MQSWTAVDASDDPLAALSDAAPLPIATFTQPSPALPVNPPPAQRGVAPSHRQNIAQPEHVARPVQSSIARREQTSVTLAEQNSMVRANQHAVPAEPAQHVNERSSASRYGLVDDRRVVVGDGRLLAVGTRSPGGIELVHVVHGAPLWRVRPGVDCRLMWLHESHDAAINWAEAERSWLVHMASETGADGATWLLEFGSAEEAERLAEGIEYRHRPSNPTPSPCAVERPAIDSRWWQLRRACMGSSRGQ
jgi:hypothetical protein